MCLVVVVVLSGAATAHPRQDATMAGPDAAANEAPTWSECVTYEGAPAGAYPNHFRIYCKQSVDPFGNPVPDEAELTIEMMDAWAYIVIIELPDDAPESMARFELNEAPGAPMQDDGVNDLEQSLPRQTRRWKTLTRDGQDEIVIVTSNWWNWKTPKNGPYRQLLYERDSFERTIQLHPGIYRATVRAQLPYEDPTGNLNPHTLETLVTAVQKGERKEEGIDLAVGPCNENFEAGPKLNELDRRHLEALATFAEGKREFESQQYMFGAESAALGAKVVITAVGQGTPGWFFGTSALSMADQIQSGRQAAGKQSKGLAQLAEVNEDRETVRKRINHCYGGGYQVPDDYQPITNQDRKEAKQPDGDTKKG